MEKFTFLESIGWFDAEIFFFLKIKNARLNPTKPDYTCLNTINLTKPD